MAVPVRGLRNIRTLSGRVDHMSVPYRAYMQITCLEMEKARREAERHSASRRIADIDTRLQEIEAEKTAILRKLSEGETAGGPERRKAGAAVAAMRSRRELKIRY